jgi:lysozyme
MMKPDGRVIALLLSLSLAGLATLSSSESFVGTATIPVPGDVPTYGYGSTRRADNSPVKLGDKITPQAARNLMLLKLKDEYEPVIHKCAGSIPMLQNEYDALVDLGYNIGPEKVCRSSIIRKFNAGDYAAGCYAILSFDMFNGKHCKDPVNLKTVNGCRGIMNRRQKQYNVCIGGA